MFSSLHSLHERETSWFGKCRNSTWKKGQDGKEHLCSASKSNWSKEERIATSNCCSVVATTFFYLQDLALLDCLEIQILSRGYIIAHASKQNNCPALPGWLQFCKGSALLYYKNSCYVKFQSEGKSRQVVWTQATQRPAYSGSAISFNSLIHCIMCTLNVLYFTANFFHMW